MKKFFSLAALLLCIAASLAQDSGTPQQRYISAYYQIAVQEMVRSGVPASITLAQGILESRSGLSPLAINGNNHFGIKCHRGWTGPSITADDDRPGECFRSYANPEESFRDHSDFLRYSDRYKFLFDLDITDYQAWAYGLKQAGYATDPSYASKLIRIVEEYDLSRYDHLTTAQAASIPASPHQIEEPVSLPTSQIPALEQYRFSLSRELYSVGGVPFVYSMEGETYRSIARQYHLFHREILRFNDLSEDEELLPGTIVYLQKKQKKAPAGLEKYIVGADGESLRQICQRFAVREKSIRKLNGFSADYVPREGDEILLR